jgi:hypothetical protein
MSNTSADAAAQAVESYLTFLKNPAALVNTELVRTLKDRLDSIEPPLERLQVLSAIYSAESVDEPAIVEAFVKYAADYARRERVVPEAFLQCGVPEEVLRAAGVLGSGARRTTKPASKAQKPKPAAKTEQARRPRSGRDAVIAAIPDHPFTFKDLESLSGSSTVTVRKVVNDLVTSGKLYVAAPDPNRTGRGPAPQRFTKGPSAKKVLASASAPTRVTKTIKARKRS